MRTNRALSAIVVVSAMLVASCGELVPDPEAAAPDVPIIEKAPLPTGDPAFDSVYDIERYWEETAPTIDLDYAPVAEDRLFARSELEDDGGVCSWNGEAEDLDPDDVADNAYVTDCDEGITVVWDDIELVPDLEKRFPGAGVATLMAHEWGHVVQFQLQLFDQTAILAEQQADCLSGAYVAWARGQGIEPFDDDQALDWAIISTLETRDEIGSSADDEDAHGNGFDRVRAMQEGFDRGAQFCMGYDETPPPVTQIPFADATDEADGGNLPYDEAVDLLGTAVADHFEALSDESLEAFVDEPDDDLLRELYDEIGDNAVGTELALRWAEALQISVGEEIDGEGPALQRACLVGTWLGDMFENGAEVGDDVISLSPFDLDESIQTFSTSNDLLANPGLVFELVASLRVGTIDGVDACALDG